MAVPDHNRRSVVVVYRKFNNRIRFEIILSLRAAKTKSKAPASAPNEANAKWRSPNGPSNAPTTNAPSKYGSSFSACWTPGSWCSPPRPRCPQWTSPSPCTTATSSTRTTTPANTKRRTRSGGLISTFTRKGKIIQRNCRKGMNFFLSKI